MTVVTAVAALCTITPTSHAGSTGSPLPGYVTPGVGYFTLFANNSWDANGVPARQFSSTFRPAPLIGYQIAGGDAAKWMWASSCSAGPQTVAFRRTVSLPGQPETLYFAVRPTVPTSGGSYWQTPFSSVTLIVNGTVVAKASGTALNSGEINDDLYGSALVHAFHFGTNTIEVIVVKRANPSYIGNCGGSNAATRLGLALSLVGQQFNDDLRVKQPPADQAVKYFRVQPGQRIPFYFTFTITNAGPAASRTGEFDVRIQPGFMVMQSDPNNDKYFPLSTPIFTNPGSPFSGCTSPTQRSVSCTYNHWLAPGRSTSVAIGFYVAAPIDQGANDIEQMFVNWGIAPTNEERDLVDNNTAGYIAYFCYPQATDPKCPPAG